MAFPLMNEDVEVISKLGTTPGSDDNLTTEQVKEKFDLAGKKLKRYLNEDLAPYLDGILGPDGIQIRNAGGKFGSTPFGYISLSQNKAQMTYKSDGTFSIQENCSAVTKCPCYLGWRLEGESRMWLYIGDMVDGEFVRDPEYDISESSSGAINYLNPSHNRFIETDGTKYFWYKIAADEGVTLVGADEFPKGMEALAVVPDFVTNEGSHQTSGDYYSVVLPSGSDYAVLVNGYPTNAMNVSWDGENGTVVLKGASFGSIPESAGAALLRIPNDCPLDSVTVYTSKEITGRTQRVSARRIAADVAGFQWISRKGVLWNDAKGTYFDEGHRFTGVPYSSRWFNAHYLGYEISPTTLANALNDPCSIAYDGGQTADGTWNVSGRTEISGTGGTGYGLVCSVLQCLLNGNPYPQSNRGFTFDSNFRVVPAVPVPGAVLLNRSLSHCVLHDEVYERGYSFIEAEDPCICRTIHTNGMNAPNYLEKKTGLDTLENYVYSVVNTDSDAHGNDLLDFEHIEIPNGAVRPWRGHKAVYGPWDKSDDDFGIGVTIHGAGTVRLFAPGAAAPVEWNPLGGTKYLDISGNVTADGTYTVDSGEGTVQEQFRYFNCESVSLHFTEDGTAVFSNDRIEYVYANVKGFGEEFGAGLEDSEGPMVIAAGKRYPDLASDVGRILRLRAAIARDPSVDADGKPDCWGRYACVCSQVITSEYTAAASDLTDSEYDALMAELEGANE